MKATGKKRYLTAAILLLTGVILMGAGLAMVDFDLDAISTQNLRTTTHTFQEDFKHIEVNVETADVTFLPSEDGTCKVVCLEEEKVSYRVGIENETLRIDTVDTRKWYDHIGIFCRTPSVTIFLPRKDYVSLFLTTVTGNVEIPEGFHFESVTVSGTTASILWGASASKSTELTTTTGAITLRSAETQTAALTATTGKITAEDVTCQTLTVKSTTGKIRLRNVIASESITAKNTTGGVQFNACDAPGIRVKTSTGSVKGTLRSGKNFTASTDTGKVSVPDTAGGGSCHISTSTGDIRIRISGGA